MEQRVLLQKLRVTQLIKKLPDFYATPKFMVVFTRTRHRSLSWARCIPSNASPYFPKSANNNV